MSTEAAGADEKVVRDPSKEIPPRQALLDAIVAYDEAKVRAMFSSQVLDALRQAVAPDATDEELRLGLVTNDGSSPSMLMTACGVGNLEAVRCGRAMLFESC